MNGRQQQCKDRGAGAGLPLLILALSLAASFSWLFGDIVSSGNIKFDPSNSGTPSYAVTTTGLGIGTTTPSTNLHVQGNAYIQSGNVTLGTSSANSTLHVQGTLGFGTQTVSANTTLSGNSVVLADTPTAGGNIVLQLPTASSVTGRQYMIKKLGSSYTATVSAGNNGGLIDDMGEVGLTTSAVGYSFLNIISGGGNQWYINAMSDNGTLSSSDNLVAWWTLNESSGNLATDATGRGHTGGLYNFTFANNAATGKVGGGLTFDGVDDKIHVDMQSDVDNISPMTLCFWAKQSNGAPVGVDVMFDNANCTAGNGFYIYNNTTGGGNTFLWAFDAATVFTGSSATIFTANTWVHVALVFDTSATNEVLVYKNGVLNTSSATGSGTPTKAISTNRFTIGSFTNNIAYNRFGGVMDDIRIYRKALSAAKIFQIYELGR